MRFLKSLTLFHAWKSVYVDYSRRCLRDFARSRRTFKNHLVHIKCTKARLFDLTIQTERGRQHEYIPLYAPTMNDDSHGSHLPPGLVDCNWVCQEYMAK